jgi:hypothetical protein
MNVMGHKNPARLLAGCRVQGLKPDLFEGLGKGFAEFDFIINNKDSSLHRNVSGSR